MSESTAAKGATLKLPYERNIVYNSLIAELKAESDDPKA